MKLALIDTRDDVIAIVLLKSDTLQEAEAEAFEMLSDVERLGCDCLDDYHEGLGTSEWYHVARLVSKEANQ